MGQPVWRGSTNVTNLLAYASCAMYMYDEKRGEYFARTRQPQGLLIEDVKHLITT